MEKLESSQFCRIFNEIGLTYLKFTRKTIHSYFRHTFHTYLDKISTEFPQFLIKKHPNDFHPCKQDRVRNKLDIFLSHTTMS